MRWLLEHSRFSQIGQVVNCGIFCIVLLFFFHPLFAAITLQDPSPTEAKFILRLRNERKSPLEVDIGDVYIKVKHKGMGRVHISYTPFTDGNEQILYQLVNAEDGILEIDSYTEYQGNGLQQNIRLWSLSARLFRPLGTENLAL
ncbi:MAG: hypothetical protein ACQ5SW_06855, partial [Sphaerochaetaceae bacterium]